MHHGSERGKCIATASRTARSYTGASLEFQKLPTDGLIYSVTVGNKRFELDPPVEIGAGQRVADLVSVDTEETTMRRQQEAPKLPMAGSTVLSR